MAGSIIFLYEIENYYSKSVDFIRLIVYSCI